MKTEYNAFIQNCPLSWWRAYMHEAYKTYAALLGRPLDKFDKRRLWTRLKKNHIGITGITSSRTLAMMESLVATEVVNGINDFQASVNRDEIEKKLSESNDELEPPSYNDDDEGPSGGNANGT